MGKYLVEMTVRAGVQEQTWSHTDYRAALGSVVTFLRKLTPYVVAGLLLAGAIMLAVSCKPASIAFRHGSEVTSLKVEVVDTPARISRGLMGRKSLPEDSGMLFDFGEDVETAFYMKDTSIPLSIAFIDAEGTILAIEDMDPYDLTSVAPPGRYRYAVEVNRGWFARNGIEAGDTAVINMDR